MTPQVVDAATFSAPSKVIGTLLPERDAIPEDFCNRRHPWCEFVTAWFYGEFPADGMHFHAKKGLDPGLAFRHVYSVLRSFEPSQQHKIYGAAYLCSCFFDKVEVPSANKVFP